MQYCNNNNNNNNNNKITHWQLFAVAIKRSFKSGPRLSPVLDKFSFRDGSVGPS